MTMIKFPTLKTTINNIHWKNVVIYIKLLKRTKHSHSLTLSLSLSLYRI
jgi:hypothetical protein